MKAARKSMAAWLCAAALAACAGPPDAQRGFGREVRALLAAQALPAEKGVRALPAMDGMAARAALAQYHQRIAPAASGVIGGAGGSGMGSAASGMSGGAP